MVGKLKERKYNSQSVHRRAEGERGEKKERKERRGDISLRGIPFLGLVRRLKLVFRMTDPHCVFCNKKKPSLFIQLTEKPRKTPTQ